ncbi:MAG: T9SS type A sorting domain-containing protein, partial [candidate division WOR-3 bacterium]
WEAKDRWWAGRAIGWGNYWKDSRTDGSTIYCSFSPDGIKDRHHPHTAQEFIRRCMGFLGMTCQPEPITAIYCSTYITSPTVDGSIIIRWKIVSDDSLKESAEGPYKLKFSRKKITSETAFNDSCEEYYQTWNTKDSTVGKWCRYILHGLPPMDTLIFALKVSDEDTLWGALGAEPRVVVSGDSVTPHYLKVGSATNPYGYVKDFSNKYEYINRRRKNDTGTDYDSLFVTWDYPMNPAWFYVGFARCDLRTEGDLFIYVDTRPGGADSTVPYNGTSGRSAFKPTSPDSFKPDFCLIVDNGSTYFYKRYVSTKDGRGSWVDTTFSGLVCEDGVVNNYLYTELYIPYANMGYTAGNPFKLVVLMTGETSNSIINAFPIYNPLGTYKEITQYYWWGSDGLTGNKVPARKYIIGIEETSLNPKSQIRNPKLTVHPNPFTEKTEIFLPSVDVPGRDASLKIYDITGRLVKSFDLATRYSLLATSIIWDGTDDNGRNVPQGIYFCKFTTPEKSDVEKIIYLK